MNTSDYSALAAAVLKRKAEGASRTGGLTRDSGIAVIAQAMHQSSRMRRRARRSALAGIAAAVALTLGSSLVINRHLTARSSPTHQCAASVPNCAAADRRAAAIDVGHVNDRRLLPGSIIQSGSAESVEVHFDSGTQLSLAAGTTVTYEEGTSVRRFSIGRGSVHFKVAKLAKGERFLLQTPDAEVEVRGTVFTTSVVSPTPTCDYRTAVVVDEGVVEVRNGTNVYRLRAGQRWPSDCVQAVEEPATSHGTAVVHRSHRGERQSPPAQPSNVAADTQESPAPTLAASAVRSKDMEATSTSALAIQNDMYARACGEMRRGDTARALASFDQLIARFPDSALIESAYAQRLRLLKQTGSSQAKQAAELYLHRFPDGFARAEARGLLGLP